MGVPGSNLTFSHPSFCEGSFISSFQNSKFGVDDRGHRLRITHTLRQLYILQQQRNNNRQVANLKGALLGNIMTTAVKTEVNPYNEQHF